MMNQKKRPEKNKFSKLKLRSASTISKKSVSPHVIQKETISKYFSSTTQDNNTNNESQIIFDSAVESQHSQISPCNINTENILNDEDDFAHIKQVKPSKIFEIKIQKESKMSIKRSKTKNDLSRFIKKSDSSSSDTNQEHLQLALAMSKSVEEYENPGQSCSQESLECESPYPSTQEKVATIKRTLDQFGFKTERSPLEIPTLKNIANKKKKFKYITPTLFLRTEEDRAKLIENKVSSILTNISVYYKNIETSHSANKNDDELQSNKPRSFLLRDYYDEDASIFKKNNLCISEMNDSKFYNNIVSKEVIKVGALLKDWHKIPGREKTPPINIIVEETEDLQNNEITIKPNPNEIDRNISPNLFSDSDSELDIIQSLNEKSSICQQNKNKGDPSLILTKSSNTPPLTILSSNSKIENSVLILSDREIFSDDSDNKSLSLLDSISPRRNKNKFDKKSINFSAKKTLFNNDEISKLEQNVRKSISPIFSCSPIKTCENDNQICHYETFCDNSNEIFDLTQSSNESSDIFNANTIITQTDIENVKNITAANESMSRSKNEENEQFIDLTQSSNDSNKKTDEIDFNCHFEKTILTNKNIPLNDITKDSFIVQNNMEDDTSNMSTETVLLIKNTKTVEKQYIAEENSNDSEKTVLLKSKYEKEENVEKLKTINNEINTFDKSYILNNSNKTTPKRKSKLFRKSISENICNTELNITPALVNVTDFFKLSSPLNISEKNNSLISQNNKFDQSIEDIEISDEEFNYSIQKSKNKHINDISTSFNDDVIDISPFSADTSSDISDEELNYSTNNSFRIKNINKDIDNIIDTDMNIIDLPYNDFEPLNFNETELSVKHPRVKVLSTPKKFTRSFSEPIIQNNTKTPENSKNNIITITPNNDFIIKTADITPMPKYEEMDSPRLREELDKFGIKPLKRAKGIKILRYIYEATHPILEKQPEKIRKTSSDEDNNRIIKRRKRNSSSENVRKRLTEHYENTDQDASVLLSEIANSEKDEDMIFERKQSVRIATCRLPLHIAWHNLVHSSQELHEKILLYEPIQVEEIYTKFKSFGFKFHIQDIISFLDKKCITIKIAQNQKKSLSS